MITKQGIGKKCEAESFHDVRRSGLIAIKLSGGDELISVAFVGKGDEVMIATSLGQSIRFKESDIRTMGRNAGGVRAIKLAKSDFVVGSDIIRKDSKDATFLVVMDNGYGKKTEVGEYKTQKRGGSGIKTAKVTDKTGKVMASKVVIDEETEELVAISKKSQVIRLDIKEIPVLGRQTQGVRVMKLRPGDNLASAVCL
jgi:DNA gyrase subunit A